MDVGAAALIIDVVRSLHLAALRCHRVKNPMQSHDTVSGRLCGPRGEIPRRRAKNGRKSAKTRRPQGDYRRNQAARIDVDRVWAPWNLSQSLLATKNSVRKNIID